MNFRFCCLRRARTRGCFTTVLRKSNSQVLLRFNITQHVRDIDLMNKICEYFQCGTVYINRKRASYNVYSNKMNTIIIAKFFIQYPVIGTKYQQFKEWIEVVEKIKLKNTINLITMWPLNVVLHE